MNYYFDSFAFKNSYYPEYLASENSNVKSANYTVKNGWYKNH